MNNSLIELTAKLVTTHWVFTLCFFILAILLLYIIIKELNSTEKKIKSIWDEADPNARLIFCGLLIIAFVDLIF